MSPSCLQCSRRAVMGISKATTTRALPQRTKGFQTQARNPLHQVTTVQWKDSWRNWHESRTLVDIRNIIRKSVSTILSPEDSNRRQTSPSSNPVTTTIAHFSSPRPIHAFFNDSLIHNFALQPQLHQRRCFRSTFRSHVADDEKITPPPTTNKEPQQSSSASSASSSSTAKSRPLPLRQAIKVPHFGLDADNAVRSMQNARKEQARAKTAANVRRALYGNLIICVSKFGAWLTSGSSSMMSEFVYVRYCKKRRHVSSFQACPLTSLFVV